MRFPKYRPRPDRDSAFVELNGQRIPLPGPKHSPESLAAYHRLVGEYLANRRTKDQTPLRNTWDLTIAQFAEQWLIHCRTYYGSAAATRSNEYDNCRYAIRPLLATFADLPLTSFRADELREVQEAMVRGDWSNPAAKRPTKPWPRSHVNAQINRIKRMFRWGVTQRLVSPDTAAVIVAVPPLKKGRTPAAESEPSCSVSVAVVEATLRHLPSVVQAMVQVQQATGMRSDNLCAMRPCDIDRASSVWVYRPARHKNEHRDKNLAVPLGPKCQALLRPYLERPEGAYVFCPQEVTNRKRGRRGPGQRYSTGTYRNAIRRAAKKAGVPHWHPHQLRHNAVEAAKGVGGLEAARAYVGHAVVKTTEIYEERDLALAAQIAWRIG